MEHRVLTLVSAVTLLWGAAACDSSTKTTSRSLAPVRFGATIAQTEPAAAPAVPARAFAPASRQLAYGGEVTITSVKVVLSGINLEDMNVREHMAGDATDTEMMVSDRANGGKMNDRRPDAHVRTVEQVDFVGPFVWDLTAQTVTPALEPVSIPTGTYHRLDLTFDALTADEAQRMGLPVSDPVVGHSYLIEGYMNHVTYGTVTDGTVKLVIYGDQSKTYHVGLHDGIAVSAATLNDVLLVFNADGWFPSSLVGQLRAGLNTGDVTVDTSGAEPVVVLDANRNMAIAAQFNKLFHGSMHVTHDRDGDMSPDSDEPSEEVPSGE